MKKNVLSSVVAMMLSVTGLAYAEDAVRADTAKQPFVIKFGDFKDMALSNTKDKPATDYKISPADYPKGVYVYAQTGIFKKRELTNVEALYTEKFKALGFKIAENRDNADLKIHLGSLKINLEEIEDGKNDDMKRGLSIADDIAGIALGAKLGANTTFIGVNGAVANALSKKQAHLQIGLVNPATGNVIASDMAATAEISEDTPAVSAAMVGMFIDEWAKAHVAHESNTQAAASEGNSH